MLTLSKNTRVTIISVIAVLAAVIIAFIVVTYAFPGYETTRENSLEANATAEIVYSVLMDDNPVYENKIVTDEKYYLQPFTKYLDIDCSLTVTTDKDALIECTSEIYGLLISELPTEDGYDIVWEKKYTYTKEQSKQVEGNAINLSRGIYVSLKEYQELTDTLMEDYSIFTSYYLRVMFDSQVTVTTETESKTEEILTYIDVPFTNNVMEIQNQSPTEETILIDRVVSTKKAPNSNLGFLLIVFLTALIICLLIVLFKTKGIDKQDAFVNEVEKIFKEYGNRLAGLTDTLAYQSSVMISIEKIVDMVKIADEIGQTIFYYEVDEEEERKIEFYVFDEGRIYYLVIFGTLKGK